MPSFQELHPGLPGRDGEVPGPASCCASQRIPNLGHGNLVDGTQECGKDLAIFETRSLEDCRRF